MRRYQWAYLAIHGNASLHASRVYNRTHSEEYNPTFLSTIEQHIADRGDSVGKTANQHASQTTRVPHKRIHNAAHEHIRKHQPLRHLQLHPFTSERFHALLNSLFKVLFNFPSRYLFAIGLATVFSLGWSIPPVLGLRSQATRLSGQPKLHY